MSSFVVRCTFPKWIMWDQERFGNPTCLVMFLSISFCFMKLLHRKEIGFTEVYISMQKEKH